MEPEQIITALLAVLGSSVVVEIIPIKINPWTWLARRIGKAILGDVTEQLSGISEQLKSHIEADARDKAKRLRGRICGLPMNYSKGSGIARSILTKSWRISRSTTDTVPHTPISPMIRPLSPSATLRTCTERGWKTTIFCREGRT